MAGDTFKGRLWVITDEAGKLIDDIDTDMIFHNSHLAITEIEKMGQFAFGNLEGWKHFAQEAKEGDMVMVGANFGSGSSASRALRARSAGLFIEATDVNDALSFCCTVSVFSSLSWTCFRPQACSGL